ncbi:hypothetical protein BGZ96_006723 [Linnemannia gamsii]|uniref:Uncharacterized protein n=1 Tax=Linnemannia gamsii TaxID=64522 RepID=A0ABQ7K1S1_9FUNG|nr:hypothetical protein BGZ96_006723 [Linnemannia gamsii]
MRRLRKRVTRVESTEAALAEDPSQKDKLEPDQLVALEKKVEMSAPLKELEDLFKAMTILQASDKLEHKKRIEGHLHDIQKSMETATEEAQDSATSAFIQVIRLFYALKQLDDARQYLTLPLSNSLKVLENFRFRLFEVAQEAELSDGDDCTLSRQELYSMVHKLAEKSTDNVVEESDITYKHIFDELDHLTFPSTDLELRDTHFVSDDHQVEDPSSTAKVHTGKEDNLDRVSVCSLMSGSTSTPAHKPCATVENWFNNISPSNPLSSEFPSESTPGPKSKGATQDLDVEQAESAPVAQVSLGREVASQTDPVVSAEPRSLPAAVPIVPTVVSMVPVHPMPDYRFMLPPWVAGSLPQAQQALSSMYVSNEPSHLTFSQSSDKDSSKSGFCPRFGRPSSGPYRESSTFRSHRVSQESYEQGGDTRHLGVIYEDDEKECSAGTNARIYGHGQYVSYYPVPIYQEPEQLQIADPNQKGSQDRVVARTIAEGAASGVRGGVSLLSGDQLKQQQQQTAYGHSSGVMTVQQSESTSFGNKVSDTSNNKESSTDSKGGLQGRRFGKKKGPGQNRSPLGQTQQYGGTKSQGQRSTESSSQLRPYAQQQQQQQQHPIDNSGHNLQFQQHSLPSCSYDHNQSNEKSQHYYRRKTQLQQRHYHDEQELSHQPEQQQEQQQSVHNYVQQPFYQYPGGGGGWYYPGYGGGAAPVYCVQRQKQGQVQQTQQEDANEGQV